jgi:hypothetical protein
MTYPIASRAPDHEAGKTMILQVWVKIYPCRGVDWVLRYPDICFLNGVPPYRDLSRVEQQDALDALRAPRARFGNWSAGAACCSWNTPWSETSRRLAEGAAIVVLTATGFASELLQWS